MLPEGKTARGYRLAWRNGPLTADDPLAAWNGLLAARGLTEADPFFSPRLAELPDPFAMHDMEKAATRVAVVITNHEKIHIFGDFDCDGVCGTAILVEALRAAGADVSFSIPHRVDDGHGIGIEPVRTACEQGVHLGISVDTGITCFDACAEAKRQGFDLIVTDHHLPEAELPGAFALLNPARKDCGFAGRRLCGAGVAFFLLMAVWRRLKADGQAPRFDLRQLLDRVALATVADMMDLVDVNRILVHYGLQRLNAHPSAGMRALMDVARVKSSVTVETIAFYLAPRINAAGRMRHGEEAMCLLSTQDAEEAIHLAGILDEANKQRRRIEAEVFRQAEDKLNGEGVLATYDESWHAGVVGLAAGRLARKHGRPAAVGFVTPDGSIRISLRGRPGFHVGELLNACAEHLRGFGGHAGTGGGTVRKGNWDAFVQAFGKAIEIQAESAADACLLSVDGVLDLGAMHAGLARRLERFEPLGRGNPAFTWLIRGVQIADRRNLKGGVLRLRLSDGPHRLDAVVFRAGPLDEALRSGSVASLIGQLKPDNWRGGNAIQFIVEDVLAG